VSSASGVAVVTVASLRDLNGELNQLPAALAAFSTHSLTHVGASVAFRGYTPGLGTVPLVIVPYSLRAWPRLRRAGLIEMRRNVLKAMGSGAALASPLALFGHVVARWPSAPPAADAIRPAQAAASGVPGFRAGP